MFLLMVAEVFSQLKIYSRNIKRCFQIRPIYAHKVSFIKICLLFSFYYSLHEQKSDDRQTKNLKQTPQKEYLPEKVIINLLSHLSVISSLHSRKQKEGLTKMRFDSSAVVIFIINHFRFILHHQVIQHLFSSKFFPKYYVRCQICKTVMF